MKIKKAAFAGSSTTLKGRPGKRLPEIAFIGRSNVGKSSLINMLCSGAEKITKGKELARTSSSPGKTISINHFLINDSWYLVDLPGYGYAKLSGKQRDELARMNNLDPAAPLHKGQPIKLKRNIDIENAVENNDDELLQD